VSRVDLQNMDGSRYVWPPAKRQRSTWIILSGSIGCCASVCIGQCRCISSARRALPTASSQREVSSVQLPPGTLLDEDEFRIDSVVLDHGTPCLAFAFEEKLRVNVWSEGLKLLRLPVGPWLSDAKRAVRRGAPYDSEIVIRPDQSIPLGVLKQHALRTARGQKFAYVVDAAYHEKNIDRIVALARGADQLFMEAPFLDMDAEVAAQRRHLTARQAGAIAKRAGVSRFVPFHFSARYRDQEDRLRCEAEQAFRE
jgi:ribonuclease Z